jgi:hypothetical protein
MQPPFHVTGDPNADWTIFIIGALVCLYWMRALRLAREGARLLLRNLAKAVIVFCISTVILTTIRMRTNLEPSQEQVIAALVALVFFGQWNSRKRSRYIPKSVKRAVIARDMKDEEYDPAKHHIDHVWPFAKGGSHTTDNLRVIEKKKNLKKRAKRPRMKEMW